MDIRARLAVARVAGAVSGRASGGRCVGAGGRRRRAARVRVRVAAVEGRVDWSPLWCAHADGDASPGRPPAPRRAPAGPVAVAA